MQKGGRKLITHDERCQVLGMLDPENYKCNAGGACSVRPAGPSPLNSLAAESKCKRLEALWAGSGELTVILNAAQGASRTPSWQFRG